MQYRLGTNVMSVSSELYIFLTDLSTAREKRPVWDSLEQNLTFGVDLQQTGAAPTVF